MNNYLYYHIILFYDLGTLLFKPLAGLGGLKNKIPQVLKQHNMAIEVVIHTLMHGNTNQKQICHKGDYPIVVNGIITLMTNLSTEMVTMMRIIIVVSALI